MNTEIFGELSAGLILLSIQISMVTIILLKEVEKIKKYLGIK